jgi:hypothetical protein
MLEPRCAQEQEICSARRTSPANIIGPWRSGTERLNAGFHLRGHDLVPRRDIVRECPRIRTKSSARVSARIPHPRCGRSGNLKTVVVLASPQPTIELARSNLHTICEGVLRGRTRATFARSTSF